MTPALANSTSLKVKTVKDMYNTAVKASVDGQDLDTLDSLFKYSDKDLQNALALSRFSRMSDKVLDLIFSNKGKDYIGEGSVGN